MAKVKRKRLPRAVSRRDKNHNRLYDARMDKKISQRELADLSGLSRNTIMRIENGDVEPSIDSCRKICSALNVQIIDIFDI